MREVEGEEFVPVVAAYVDEEDGGGGGRSVREEVRGEGEDLVPGLQAGAAGGHVVVEVLALVGVGVKVGEDGGAVGVEEGGGGGGGGVELVEGFVGVEVGH